MKKATMLLAASMVLVSTLACTITQRIPDLDIRVPTIQVGEIQEETHSVPLAGAESADVDIHFGAGQLQLRAGVADELLSGTFRYNVDRWAPQITREGNTLTLRQGGDEDKWGIPSGNVRNRWELELSPQVPLDLTVRVGAGEGELDLTDLQVSNLDVDLGAGDFVLRFDEPNPLAMEHFAVDAGASKMEVLGVGNASPQTMRLQGGVGDISVDLTGRWTRSADIEIRAGAGALTLRLPNEVGIEVTRRGGIANVEAYGLRQMGNTYTNDAFGETEIELAIEVVTGVGNLRVIEEGALE